MVFLFLEFNAIPAGTDPAEITEFSSRECPIAQRWDVLYLVSLDTPGVSTLLVLAGTGTGNNSTNRRVRVAPDSGVQ